MPHLVFVVNNADFLVSHRLCLVDGALRDGFSVSAVAPPGSVPEALTARGVTVHPWQVSRKGQHLAAEAASVARLVGLYRALRPDVVHHVTIKPVLYGSAAARVTGVRGVVNAVSGLGYVFLARGVAAAARRTAVALAYRAALSGPRTTVVLQNDDDEADLRRFGALPASASVEKIRGSGVDLTRF
ncbi:MAG: glycosyltransferase family 1 protein, partial [Archangium sp.]|nr:glycosyltransferase family 1 protein [Archangium sp.]